MRFAIAVLAIAIGEVLGIWVADVLADVKSEPVAVIVEHGPNLPHRATARLRVMVDPSTANRGLWVAIEASGYAAASYQQLEGAQSPRTRWVEFKDLPDGAYTAWVRLIREHGEVSNSAPFSVGAVEEEETFP